MAILSRDRSAGERDPVASPRVQHRVMDQSERFRGRYDLMTQRWNGGRFAHAGPVRAAARGYEVRIGEDESDNRDHWTDR